MSGETYVVGTLEIMPGVPEEKKAKIVEDFEEVLETDLIWDEQSKQYNFSHINWSSHVSEDEIQKCHQKHKRHIKYISISLWYLSESDFSLHMDRSEHALVFGQWYKQRPATFKESTACLFGTLLPSTR
ncbi:hypothetical protein METP3_01218 [Methanosarcinales archaeon]|nr:MAG: hypothetical protein OI861_00205 [Candidatus Methanoperedens sp.]CAG0967183.1 hypothetical protein METP3_01218 [Methanosarcinales archaeon]